MSKAAQVPPIADRQKPGLSETLGPAPRHRHICASCGVDDRDEDLLGDNTREPHKFWQECDPFDKPIVPARVITLCGRCSKALIDPHPRLYIAVDPNQPLPGAMEMCVDCVLRQGMACMSPNLKSNGGQGMLVTFPAPIRAFLCGGRGASGHHVQYTGAPSKCADRRTLAVVA